MQTVDAKIRRRIAGSGRGTLFTPARFLDVGGRHAVDKTLSRLAARGMIHRVARGLYIYPQEHPVLGTLSPQPEAVAKALAKRDAIKVQPAGAYAANLLGLSEQVPAKIVFLTDGPSRTVRLGSMVITLRHTTPRNMAAAGRLSGVVIQALRYLGKEHVTPALVAHLRRGIPAAERSKLLQDLKYAPTWMHPVLRALARDEE